VNKALLSALVGLQSFKHKRTINLKAEQPITEEWNKERPSFVLTKNKNKYSNPTPTAILNLYPVLLTAVFDLMYPLF
jgi:hypothetical protein